MPGIISVKVVNISFEFLKLLSEEIFFAKSAQIIAWSEGDPTAKVIPATKGLIWILHIRMSIGFAARLFVVVDGHLFPCIEAKASWRLRERMKFFNLLPYISSLASMPTIILRPFSMNDFISSVKSFSN